MHQHHGHQEQDQREGDLDVAFHHVEVGEGLASQALLCLQHPVWAKIKSIFKSSAPSLGKDQVNFQVLSAPSLGTDQVNFQILLDLSPINLTQ